MESFLQQIDKFYRSELRSDALICMGCTPKVLLDLGAENLSLVMKQSVLRKCIRKSRGSRSAHDIPRAVVEKLPNEINSPIAVVKDVSRNAFALILESRDRKGYNILLAVHIKQDIYGSKFNEVKSFYGKSNLRTYFQNIGNKEMFIIDKEKAKRLSLTIGLQLPQAPTTPGHVHNIQEEKPDVNANHKKSKSDIARDLRKQGFQPTKSLIKNMEKLNEICGRNCTLTDIYKIYKGKRTAQSEERKLAVNIAKECKEQELYKKSHVQER